MANKTTGYHKNNILKIVATILMLFIHSTASADLEELWDSLAGPKPTKETKKKGYWVDLSGQRVCTLTWNGSRLLAAKHPLEQKDFWTIYNSSAIMNDGIRYEVAFPDSVLTHYDRETKKLFMYNQILLSSTYECRKRY